MAGASIGGCGEVRGKGDAKRGGTGDTGGERKTSGSEQVVAESVEAAAWRERITGNNPSLQAHSYNSAHSLRALRPYPFGVNGPQTALQGQLPTCCAVREVVKQQLMAPRKLYASLTAITLPVRNSKSNAYQSH